MKKKLHASKQPLKAKKCLKRVLMPLHVNNQLWIPAYGHVLSPLNDSNVKTCTPGVVPLLNWPSWSSPPVSPGVWAARLPCLAAPCNTLCCGSSQSSLSVLQSDVCHLRVQIVLQARKKEGFWLYCRVFSLLFGSISSAAFCSQRKQTFWFFKKKNKNNRDVTESIVVKTTTKQAKRALHSWVITF